jgi:hypothetical protein
MPYGDRLRLHRKLLHQVLSAEASAEYHDLYIRKAYQLVINLLNSPQKMERHFEMFVEVAQSSLLFPLMLCALGILVHSS